jgi:hypothetical protein
MAVVASHYIHSHVNAIIYSARLLLFPSRYNFDSIHCIQKRGFSTMKVPVGGPELIKARP